MRTTSLSRLIATAVLMLAVLASVGSAAADVIHIDPFAPPATTLPPQEAQRLSTLLGASFVALTSDVSPDDRRILANTPTGRVLLDIRTGASTPFNVDTHGLSLVSELRWRDAQTLVAIGFSGNPFAFHEVTISVDTGAVTSRPLAIDGFPFTLSPRGSRLLFVRELTASGAEAARSTTSPLREVQRPRFRRAGPAIFDEDSRLRVHVAATAIRLVLVDLATGKEQVLIDFPEDMGLSSLSWSRDETRLAMVRSAFGDFSRGGTVPPDSPTVLDGLGRLAPEANPFFTTNVLDVFELGGGTVEHREIRPGVPGGPLFAFADWSTDGRTLVAQMGVPSHPKGREFPSYLNFNAASYRFYTPQGQRRSSLDRPEVDSPFGLPIFLSPHELVIRTVRGPSWRLYHYNLHTRQLRRLPTDSGAIYQTRPTNHSRQIVYNFGSVKQPYEIFQVGTDGRSPRLLTNVNAAVAAANRVRVDRVPFLLGRGGTREGFLIQPAGAPFPPRNKPLIVWQQGGPSGPMTDDWGGFVEQPFNLLPNFGLAVLVVPLEGRWGFGPERFDALADGKNFGQIDIDEQALIVAQLVGRGYTSLGQVGVTGCSYGGYFASQSVTRWPGLYAAANPQCSLLDLVDEWNTGFTGYIGYLEGRALDEDTREYQRDSPLTNADRVKTPTLLFAGSRDFLPWEFSLAFHDGIAGAGTPARLLVFEDEGHGLSFPSSQRVAGESQLLWFRQHLDGQ